MIITAFASSGTGKTTLLSHLAYLLALEGLSVALIDVDNRSSIETCCGVTDIRPEETTSKILTKDFNGDYPFVPLWPEYCKNAEVIVADKDRLSTTNNVLTAEPFGILQLRNTLQKYPLPHDVVLLDAPGQEGTLAWTAILASTHLILSVEMSKKSIKDVTFAISRLYEYRQMLGIPVPKVVGFVPGRYDHDFSFMARSTLKQFPEIAESLKCTLFSPIRRSPYFWNSYSAGVPVQIYAPGFEGNKDFTEAGNLFKNMSKKRRKDFDSRFDKLPAILPYILKELNNA